MPVEMIMQASSLDFAGSSCKLQSKGQKYDPLALKHVKHIEMK